MLDRAQCFLIGQVCHSKRWSVLAQRCLPIHDLRLPVLPHTAHSLELTSSGWAGDELADQVAP